MISLTPARDSIREVIPKKVLRKDMRPNVDVNNHLECFGVLPGHIRRGNISFNLKQLSLYVITLFGFLVFFVNLNANWLLKGNDVARFYLGYFLKPFKDVEDELMCFANIFFLKLFAGSGCFLYATHNRKLLSWLDLFEFMSGDGDYESTRLGREDAILFYKRTRIAIFICKSMPILAEIIGSVFIVYGMMIMYGERDRNIMDMVVIILWFVVFAYTTYFANAHNLCATLYSYLIIYYLKLRCNIHREYLDDVIRLSKMSKYKKLPLRVTKMVILQCNQLLHDIDHYSRFVNKMTGVDIAAGATMTIFCSFVIFFTSAHYFAKILQAQFSLLGFFAYFSFNFLSASSIASQVTESFKAWTYVLYAI